MEKIPRPNKDRILKYLIMKRAVEKAVNEVLEKKLTPIKAAQKYGISKTTISRHVSRFHRGEQKDFSYNPRHGVHKVLSIDEEMKLEEYLHYYSNINYGLTQLEIRKLAYQFATSIGINFQSWETNKMAGIRWFHTFKQRHPSFSFDKEDPACIRTNAMAFFANLKTVMNRYKFEPTRVWNLNEIILSTVHFPPKVFNAEDKKEIKRASLLESGNNISVIFTGSAAGDRIPPFFLFPRLVFKRAMLNGSPPGSVGMANPSGASNEETYTRYFEHFKSFIKPNKEHPILLIMEPNGIQKAFGAIEKAKEDGMVLVTQPPCGSQRVLPLHETVLAPFKRLYCKIIGEWLNNPKNLGQPVSIYEAAELIGEAYESAFTAENIISSFKKRGLYPVNDPFTVKKDL